MSVGEVDERTHPLGAQQDVGVDGHGVPFESEAGESAERPETWVSERSAMVLEPSGLGLGPRQRDALDDLLLGDDEDD
ncbi:hypothetical protein GCM10022204_08550 [Microlunatus aurantiacus]|uniref:DUF5709 domain-containing protein n=1 Tax=Microlunatus aurantiacus TaxID=446786 RepID=A0ABP7CVF6_9ACTN